MDQLPYEVLEQIAFFLATDTFLGPPSALLPFLLVSRKIYSTLSIHSNPHLYSRIFASKFDSRSPLIHPGVQRSSPTAIADEFRRRCLCLNRIKAQLDCSDPAPPNVSCRTGPSYLEPTVLIAFLMMLEDAGKNEAQLIHYAQINVWLQTYWFDYRGCSRVKLSFKQGSWPENNSLTAASMWLLLLFFQPDDYALNEDLIHSVGNLFKAYALGAQYYPGSNFPWNEYSPLRPSLDPIITTAYGEPLELAPLPIAIPAILAYLTFFPKLRFAFPLSPHTTLLLHDINQRSSWRRLILRGSDTNFLVPGNFDGVWQGIFTYSDFHAYTTMLQGAPPTSILPTDLPEQRQTWIIREYVLLSSDEGDPIPVGGPLHAFFPFDEVTIKESWGVLTVLGESGESTQYTRFSAISDWTDKTARDIVLIGEGHSVWGQFTLIGRVRPRDGFATLEKHYSLGDRGTWVYRGYIIGSHFVGRWRDTMTPVDHNGYEGCFLMGRRGESGGI